MKRLWAMLILAATLLAGCGSSAVTEVEPQIIRLTRPASISTSEISGLAWYGDWLVLLPQFPRRIRGTGERDGGLLAIRRSDLLAYLDGEGPERLDPIRVPFDAQRLTRGIRGFQGFEAIAFSGQHVYLTIESKPKAMLGYVVRGEVVGDLEAIRLEPETVQPIEPRARVENMTDEALLIAGDEVLTFYEANGARVNPIPVVHRFSLDLRPLGTLPLDPLEYRITDATALDLSNRFWVTNFFVPIDWRLIAFSDPVASRWGIGATHQRALIVERLVELEWTEDRLRRVDRAPLYLHLDALDPRNWEGIARLEGRGLLIVTDKNPDTILAFVPFDDERVPQAESQQARP
jgi:hypothetical protein